MPARRRRDANYEALGIAHSYLQVVRRVSTRYHLSRDRIAYKSKHGLVLALDACSWPAAGWDRSLVSYESTGASRARTYGAPVPDLGRPAARSTNGRQSTTALETTPLMLDLVSKHPLCTLNDAGEAPSSQRT